MRILKPNLIFKAIKVLENCLMKRSAIADDFYSSTIASQIIINLAFKKEATDERVAELIANYLEKNSLEIMIRHALELLLNSSIKDVRRKLLELEKKYA